MINKYFNVTNKVAVITGGAGYLCSEMAKGLSSCGAKVIILDRNVEKAKKIANSISKKYNHCEGIYLDSTKKNSFIDCASYIIKKYKKINILINGAGINAPTDFFKITEKEFDSIISTHLKGTMFGCQTFGKFMINNKKGSIVNISSASSGPPLSKAFIYSAAKSGINNLTQNLAREFAKHNVRVNALRPGFFPTEWSKKNFIDKKREKVILNHTPMRRYGIPKELVGTILWLCSDSSSFVTGAEVPVDGGFTSMTI
tara:strand:- start:3861 stop:4631 length:771 start_codon:yes stop_codon:yes gene_type:complete